MNLKGVFGQVTPEIHRRLVLICGREGITIGNMVGTIIEGYVESNHKEVFEDGGKGTSGVHGENERKPKINDRGNGKTVEKPSAEAPSRKLEWLPASA